MITVFLVAIVVIVPLAMAAAAEQRRFDAGRQTRLRAITTDRAALQPTPIDPSWLVAGEPVTEAAEIARSDDGTTCVYLWQTTRARYRWTHESDETVVVLEGEVFLADERSSDQQERRLGPGDVAFFPAGTSTLWRVPERLRKISTLTRPPPPFLANLLRWLRAIKRWARTPVATGPRPARNKPKLRAQARSFADDCKGEARR